MAVLLTVTSVLFDFPIKTGFETSAADTYTVNFSVNSVGKGWGSASDGHHGSLNATSVTQEKNISDKLSDDRLYDFSFSVESGKEFLYVVPATLRSIEFVGWDYTVGNSDVTTNGNQIRSRAVREDISFIAYFRIKEFDGQTLYTMSYNSQDGGYIEGGALPVFSNAKYSNEVAQDFSVNKTNNFISGATAHANAGYVFIGWYDEDDNLVCETENFTPSGNLIKTATYTAKFAKIIPIIYTTTDSENVTLTVSTTDYYIVGADDSEQTHISDSASADAVSPNAGAVRTNAVYWVNQQNEGLALGGTTTDKDNNVTEKISATLDKATIISEIKKALQDNSDLTNYTFTAKFSKYYTKKIKWEINGEDYGSNSAQNGGNSWINFNISTGKVTISHRNTAVAKDGGKFVKWVVKGDNNEYQYIDSTGNIGGTYNPDMPWTDFIDKSEYTVTSYFVEKVINISIEQDNNENGSIKHDGNTISTPITLTNPTGTLKATPSDSSILFDYWEIISPDGTIAKDYSLSLDLTALNPNDDTQIIAHYKSAFSITVQQNNDDYGSISYQNGTTTQTITSTATLSESVGTLTAQPKEGFAFVNWSVKYSNGNVESFIDETIDLSTIGADNGTNITANYKIADGWVMIRYEVVDTENTINYPVKLKFINDDSTLVGDYSQTNSTQPYLTELVHVSAGEEAKGVEAVMLGATVKYSDGNTYKFMGWEEENGYIFSEEIVLKPEGRYLVDRIGDTGDGIITYRAQSRQTKNYYLIVQYNENIDDGSNIYDSRTSSGAPSRKEPITSVIQYVGYATIDSEGNIESVKPFLNLNDSKAEYQFVPAAEIPLGYEFK